MHFLLVDNTRAIIRYQVDQTLAELVKVVDESLLGAFVELRRDEHKVDLGHLHAHLVDQREFIESLVDVGNAVEVEQARLLRVFHLELVGVVVEKQILEVGRHLVADVVVKVHVRPQIISLFFEEFEFVMQVSNS